MIKKSDSGGEGATPGKKQSAPAKKQAATKSAPKSKPAAQPEPNRPEPEPEPEGKPSPSPSIPEFALRADDVMAVAILEVYSKMIGSKGDPAQKLRVDRKRESFIAYLGAK